MSDYRDVMIDLETFGNGKNACIVQVGACYFDRDTGEIGRTFKMNVDARDAVRRGGVIDPDTVYWWLSQDSKAISSITSGDLHTIEFVMDALNEFIFHSENIWSHATFDFVIVTETMKSLHIKPKFSYRSARDIRTLTHLAGIDFKGRVRIGTHHDALDDCFYQVEYCVEALKVLKGKLDERNS